MKKLLWYISLAIVPLFLCVAVVSASGHSFNETLKTQEMCEESGGYWNGCPPNDCLKENPAGSDCTRACGQASCDLPATSGGPYYKEMCEDNGGWWNLCPPNDCVKSGGAGCPASCGEAICEFTPVPKNQEECDARDGLWLDCPTAIECLESGADFCTLHCGEPRCRLYKQANHPNETACEILEGYWNEKAPDPENPNNSVKMSACELVAAPDMMMTPMNEIMPENKEECDAKYMEGWYWEDCPKVDGCVDDEGMDCEGECGTPGCMKIGKEKCTDDGWFWDQDITKCDMTYDIAPSTQKGCTSRLNEGWWWDMDASECKMFTKETCKEKEGAWKGEDEEPPCVFEPKPPFPDVKNHKYVKAIEFVKDNNIVDGYPDGSYGANNMINRAEFTKIIIETIFPGEASGENCFLDVHSEWFAPYVCFAKKQGIIEGYDDGNFLPNSHVNWAEALKITLEAFALDMPEFDGIWYGKYTLYAEQNGLDIPGIEPHTSLKRGEMAELIYRLMNM